MAGWSRKGWEGRRPQPWDTILCAGVLLQADYLRERRGLSFVPALADRSKTIRRRLCWRPLVPFLSQKVLSVVWDRFRASAGLLAHGVYRENLRAELFWRRRWPMAFVVGMRER